MMSDHLRDFNIIIRFLIRSAKSMMQHYKKMKSIFFIAIVISKDCGGGSHAYTGTTNGWENSAIFVLDPGVSGRVPHIIHLVSHLVSVGRQRHIPTIVLLSYYTRILLSERRKVIRVISSSVIQFLVTDFSTLSQNCIQCLVNLINRVLIHYFLRPPASMFSNKV